jgi:hypothetical protein
MTLSNADGLSGDEAQRLTPQEVDPVDEETPAKAEPKAKARSRPRGPRDPLVDTTPFGIDPVPPEAPANAMEAADADDRALFETLWPLGEIVKLDTTVDRRTLRQQRDRLDALGYSFQPLSQEWHRVKA